jgi:hypothetical protein
MKPPEFKGGNKWFAKALNLVVSYARRHGVNPAGVAGWSETADGWMPPRNAASEIALSLPWKMTVINAEAGEVKLEPGTILKGSDSITEKLTITNPTATLTVEADGFIALKINSEAPTTCELVALEEWPEDDGYQVTYTGTMGGDDFTFVERHYPLWKIIAESTPTSTPIGSELHAEQLCFDHLQLQYGIYRTPDGEFVQLPGFAASHRAA